MFGWFGKKGKQSPFDEVPSHFTSIDMWTTQISGEKYFDNCSFMGTFNALQYSPQWRQLFESVKDQPGVFQFLDRLEKHFALTPLPVARPDGSQLLYMQPASVDYTSIEDAEKIMELVDRYLTTVSEALEANGQISKAKLIQNILIKTVGEGHFESLPGFGTIDYLDAEPLGFLISEAWGFSKYREDVPDIFGPISEASFSLANEPALHRYLMQSFETHDLDVDAEYELIWKYATAVYFNENTCFVKIPKTN